MTPELRKRIDDYVARLVAQAPPATAAQVALVAALVAASRPPRAAWMRSAAAA